MRLDKLEVIEERAVPMQRASGIANIRFKRRGDQSVIDDLYQQGSAKVKFARREPGRLCEAVLINTSGGMTDGDEYKCDAHWGEKTTAIVTTQAAERYYKSLGSPAKITTNLLVDKDACALWLPQESIMFDGASYERKTAITLGNNSRLLALETSVFGRHAMGETINNGRVRERWQIRKNDRLIFADAFGLDGKIDDLLDRPAIGAGARVMTTIVYVGPENEKIRDEVNALIELHNAKGRATCIDEITIIRLFAPEGKHLRKNVMVVLGHLISKVTAGLGLDLGETGSLLPRVWTM